MRRGFIALFLAFFALTGPVGAEPIAIEAEAVPMNPQDPAQDRVGALRYRGGVVLRSPDRRFGGWSDLRVRPDGRVLAVSDHGYTLTARLTLDAEGRLTGLAGGDLTILRDSEGRPLVAKSDSDAEGLAWAPDGQGFIVSFERKHRLARYRHPDAPAEPLAGPTGLADLPTNGGLETLLTLADGRLFLLAEEREGADEARGWIGRPGKEWKEFRYPLSQGFRATGAALLPGGDVLVLERRYTMVAGPGARLWRLPMAGLDRGKPEGALLAELGLPLSLDNMEGVEVVRGADGRLMVYVIADDNYNPLQRSLLLQFELDLP